MTLQGVGDRVVGRQREVVARRALQHGHLGAAVGERGHERRRGRAAADDHDARTLDLEPLRPVLGVEVRTGEAIDPGELGEVTLVVAVVAGAGDHPPAPETHGFAGVDPFGVDLPARVGRRPRDPPHAVAEPQVTPQIELVDRVVEVLQDGVTFGQRVRPGPGLPRVRVGLEVGVGPHPGEAEQVPRPADRVAGVQHRERHVGERVAEVPGGADAGDPGTDDHHVDPLRVDPLLRVHAVRLGGGDDLLHREQATVVVVGQRAQRRTTVTLERRPVHDRQPRRREVGEDADRAGGLRRRGTWPGTCPRRRRPPRAGRRR